MMGLYLGGFVGMFNETALNISLPKLSEVFDVKQGLIISLRMGKDTPAVRRRGTALYASR